MLILLNRYPVTEPKPCHVCGIWPASGETDPGPLACITCQEKVDRYLFENYRIYRERKEDEKTLGIAKELQPEKREVNNGLLRY